MPGGRVAQLVRGECSCDAPSTCGCVVVDSSVMSVVLTLSGPVILVVLASYWVSVGSATWVIGLLIAGILVLGVVFFDMPVSAVFSDSGVLRRTPLRDHHLGWERIDALTLTRARRPGLVAAVGRRKYLLAERSALSFDEVDMLNRMRPT